MHQRFRPLPCLWLSLLAATALTGCATERHTTRLGNYKVVTGLGPAAQRWEIIKASAAGWKIVASSDHEDGNVLVLHKPKD